MIHLRSLSKDFTVPGGEVVHAVRGITLDVSPGELVAVLGPNGAGKSTTLRMLTTLVAPTAGTATVVGHDVVAAPAEVRRRIGYVGQGNGAGHAQLVGDELRSQGRIHGLSADRAASRADELMAALDLAELARRKVGDLSGGQRRRLDIAMGIVHQPTLLFLDEPSTGLDPQSRANLWAHILRIRAELGMTVVLTTHYLDEADAMAERVVVVDHGEVIADDTAEALKADLAGDRVDLEVPTAPDAVALSGALAALPQVVDVAARDQRLEARVAHGPRAVPAVLAAAASTGTAVLAVDVHRPTLDDVFLSLTGRSLREDGRADIERPTADTTPDPTRTTTTREEITA
ncbi:ABC transporter ATP-binding protein [Euzebya sp.]|uniref:ABC transporter ATP-binding protein n=1 Tax=Euzebya sp. TaxID=1971409 RepID=UPI003511FCFE